MGRTMSRVVRLQRIEALLLARPQGLSVRELAQRLDVHRTTIWRDLTELSRDLPVYEEGGRYAIERPDQASGPRLNRAESLMLYLALRRLLRSPAHCPPLMLLALEKLSLSLRDPSSRLMAEWIETAQAHSQADPHQRQLWETLVQAWVDGCVVRLSYQAIRRTVVEEFEVEPYLFEPALLSENVYLVGRCLQDGRVRMFPIERILHATPTGRRFDRPHSDRVGSLLRDLWGTWHGQGLTQVQLRFTDPAVIRRIRRTVWIPGQTLHDHPEGGVKWSAAVPDPLELVPWIRAWGPACEVLAPDELLERITEVEQFHGGATVTADTFPRTTQFSEAFFASLEAIPDGERIRSCLQCASCSGICPLGSVMEYPPRRMIAALRAGMFDAVVETTSAWLCVSCYACSEVCPAKIPLTAGLMTRVKEEMILAGEVPGELQQAMENTQRLGNPMGESPRKRGDWAKSAGVPVPLLASLDRPVDVLWFVGDYASYHRRAQTTAFALARLFHTLGIDFAILGPEESSDGDSQRLAGERGLFEMLAEKNGRAFRKYAFREIVTSDPHAFNALKNEYPKVGISYPVRHYTQLLAERLEDLRPRLSRPLDATVTFHDPCYLGRVNGVFDEPRRLLRAIPGIELVEMSHAREASLCCGGGGGGMWLDGFQWERTHTRLSEVRVQEALAASANILVSLGPPLPEKKPRKRTEAPARPEGQRILAIACPYEGPRFEDAVKVVPGASHLIVRDVAELLSDALAG